MFETAKIINIKCPQCWKKISTLDIAGTVICNRCGKKIDLSNYVQDLQLKIKRNKINNLIISGCK